MTTVAEVKAELAAILQGAKKPKRVIAPRVGRPAPVSLAKYKRLPQIENTGVPTYEPAAGVSTLEKKFPLLTKGVSNA